MWVWFFFSFLFFFKFFWCIFMYSSKSDIIPGGKDCAAADPLPPSFQQDPAEEGWRDDEQQPSVCPSIHPPPRALPPPLQPYRARWLQRRERRTGAERSRLPAPPSRAPAVMSASLLLLLLLLGSRAAPPPQRVEGGGGTRLPSRRRENCRSRWMTSSPDAASLLPNCILCRMEISHLWVSIHP